MLLNTHFGCRKRATGRCHAAAHLRAACACCPLQASSSATIVTELLDGRPHGDEGELLQHFEAEVEASIARLRQLKAANEGTQAAISDVVAQVGCLCALLLQHILRVCAEGGCSIFSRRVAVLPGAALPLPHPHLAACLHPCCLRQIAAAHDGLERQRAAVAGELARLQQDVAQHEADMGQPLPQLPEGGWGHPGWVVLGVSLALMSGPLRLCCVLPAPLQALARRSARWHWGLAPARHGSWRRPLQRRWVPRPCAD